MEINPVTGALTAGARAKALFGVAVACVFLFLCGPVATSAAQGLSQRIFNGQGDEVLRYAVLLFLYLMGFTLIGRILDREERPISAMGLSRRPGWGQEIAIGVAIGWGLITATVLLIALFGGLRVSFDGSASAWTALLANTIVLGLAALTEEIAFRGYAFQHLVNAFGTVWSTVIVSTLFTAAHAGNPGASFSSALVTFAAGVLFSIAYVRTRGLWLPWGMHFGWNFALVDLFGLPMSGIWRFGTIVRGRAHGSRLLTGGNYGPEASLTIAFLLIPALIVLVNATRNYAWERSGPVIVPGGRPVEIGEPAVHAAYHRAPEPTAIDGPEGKGKLVQIKLN